MFEIVVSTRLKFISYPALLLKLRWDTPHLSNYTLDCLLFERANWKSIDFKNYVAKLYAKITDIINNRVTLFLLADL